MSSDASSAAGTLVAACANCASWRAVNLGPVGGHGTSTPVDGVCMKGLAPAPGEPRCDSYLVSPSFERQILSRLMQDPMVLPVPLRGKAAKEARRRLRKQKG